MGTNSRGKPFLVGAMLGGVALSGPSTRAADEQPFTSRAAAEAYLATALPAATAANPKYKDPQSDTETRWLTKSLTFKKDGDGGLVVAMREAIVKYRGENIIEEGSHSAEFPIELTGVELISDAWVPVDTIDAAAGILFRCPKDPCIRTVRDGKNSVDAQTDITISDRDTLAKLYAAFRALLKGSGMPD